MPRWQRRQIVSWLVLKTLWPAGTGRWSCPCNSALVKPCLKCCVQLLVPHYRKDTKVLWHVQGRTTRLVKGLKHLAYEESEQKTMSGQDRTCISLVWPIQVYHDTDLEEMDASCTWGGLDWVSGNTFTLKGFSDFGMISLGQWNHHPCRWLNSLWTRPLRSQFSVDLAFAWSKVKLNDLEGLSQ